jgi:ketosteroid isomerase-like protein
VSDLANSQETRAERPSNIPALEAFYKAFNRGDADAVVEFLDRDFEWSPAFGHNLLGSNFYVGHDGFRRYMADVAEVFEGYNVERLRVEELGDAVLITGRATARGRSSGLAIGQEFTMMYVFREGLMIRGKTYRDHAEAVRAARALLAEN